MLGVNGYKLLRYAGSNVHTFECSKSQNVVIYTEGIKGKLQTLAEMASAYPDAIAAMNGPFFNYDASSEDCIRWSKYATTVSFTHDKILRFLNGAVLTQIQRNAFEKDSYWSAGLGCTLVEKGIERIRNTQPGEPLNPNARSIIMQTNDGSLMFAVVQGKMKPSAGLKAIAAINLLNKGMNAKTAAAFSISAKARSSAFCDGGGSSEIAIKVNGKWVTMNKPTDGASRHIGGCFIVLKQVPKSIVEPEYSIIDAKLKFDGKINGENTQLSVVVHHALSPKCTIWDVDKWHKENGWAGCGYHYFINKVGEIYKGRPDNVPGAHCIEDQMNYKSLGVCLEGCYENYVVDVKDKDGKVIGSKDLVEKEVPKAQLDALTWLVKVYLKKDKVYPHNLFATYKKCPGNFFPWAEFMKEVHKA
jgi:hypothetical protein